MNQITGFFRTFARKYMHTRMYLPDTKPMALRTVHSNKQCINLNSNDFGEWYCVVNNSRSVLTNNLFRCFRKVSESVAELTKSVRSCQNSWKKCHFSHFICRLSFQSVPLQKNQKQNQIKFKYSHEKITFTLRSYVLHGYDAGRDCVS